MTETLDLAAIKTRLEQLAVNPCTQRRDIGLLVHEVERLQAENQRLTAYCADAEGYPDKINAIVRLQDQVRRMGHTMQQLRAENARMKAALAQFANRNNWSGFEWWQEGHCDIAGWEMAEQALSQAGT